MKRREAVKRMKVHGVAKRLTFDEEEDEKSPPRRNCYKIVVDEE